MRAVPTVSFLLTMGTIFAGSTDKEVSVKDIETPERSAIVQNLSANYSYVGAADIKSGSDGSVTEQTSGFQYDWRMPVNDTVGVGFGVGYKRFDFGTPEGSFLPDNLQTVTFTALAHYKIDNQWSAFAMFGPRLNLVNDWGEIDSQNIHLGGAIGARYEYNKDLAIQFGLALNPDVDGVPVMPIGGVRWHFAEQWTLNVGFPRTAVDYQLLSNLRLSLETDFMGGTYHTSSTYGNDVGNPELNDRSLHYNEVRVGVGALYNLTKNIDIELSAGAAVYREFDFKDTGVDTKLEPAPYVKTGVKLNF